METDWLEFMINIMKLLVNVKNSEAFFTVGIVIAAVIILGLLAWAFGDVFIMWVKMFTLGILILGIVGIVLSIVFADPILNVLQGMQTFQQQFIDTQDTVSTIKRTYDTVQNGGLDGITSLIKSYL